MAFLIFDRKESAGRGVFHSTSETFSLAGDNLLFAAWQQLGSPVDSGWHVTADDLVRLHFQNEHTAETKRFVIDFDPNATRRIGLIELLDIYAFTWSDGSGGPEWTPLMLRLRDVFYKEYEPPVDPARKAEILSQVDEPSPDTPDFVEFLYLNGPRYSWNWGRNGMTNAAFLNGGAREYFRKFF